MSMDHLLLWLSVKGQGSWSQFRAAVEEIHVQQEDRAVEPDDEGDRSIGAESGLPIYQQVRFSLQRLGHVEFFSREADNGWRVVPPAVAFLPGSRGEGVLCGARSPALFEGIDSAEDVEVHRSDAPGMPQRLLLRGVSREVVADHARLLGFHIQADAPTAILSAVPGTRDHTTWYKTSMPENPGWTVHRFSSSRLSWTEVAQVDATETRTGLFRFVMKHQRFYYLRWSGRSYRVPVQVGKYAVMRRRRGILAYDAGTGVLSVPAVCRPPLLIERALGLCSGFLPCFNPSSGRVEYADVSPDIVRISAQLLRQEVQ